MVGVRRVTVTSGFALACLAVGLLLSACGGSSGSSGPSGSTPTTGSTGTEGGELKSVIASFPDYLDPALVNSTEGLTATYDTYIPLLTYAHANGKAGGEVIPGLARSMPVVSDGGRTYTLFLRKGLEYSDGTPVRASDFPYAVERVFRLNGTGSVFFDDIVGAEKFAKDKQGGIPGIEADDETGEIVIHLVKPRGTFENELGLPYVAPVPKGTPNEDLSGNPPPATGPYVIASSKPGRGWTYERNPRWASNNAALLPQIPSGHVDKISVAVVRNGSTEVNGVENGEYDWMQNQPPADRYNAVLEKYEGTQLRVDPAVSTYFFWMNTTVAPFNDVKVRQAVNYAVDPRALERIYSGQIVGTQQILPPGMPGYKRLDLYPHSLAKARQLVAEANPSDRSVTVWTDSESPNNDAGAYYQGVLEKIGFDVTLKVLGSDNYFTVVGNATTPNLDTGFANWFEDYPHPNDFFQPLLAAESASPTNASNLSRFVDPALDAKIAKLGEQALGPKQEAEYADLDREFMEQAPMAPYGTSTVATFVSSAIDLEAVVVNPTFGQDLTSFQFK
jgi:peptide/nickel transport system substrate-binding protein